MPRATPSQVFAPQWPPGLDTDEAHKVLCDDKGGRCWFSVLVAKDGDAHLMAHEEGAGEDGGVEDPFPSVRIRTYAGGGRSLRTHQALLWLALAIKLDNKEARRVR